MINFFESKNSMITADYSLLLYCLSKLPLKHWHNVIMANYESPSSTEYNTKMLSIIGLSLAGIVGINMLFPVTNAIISLSNEQKHITYRTESVRVTEPEPEPEPVIRTRTRTRPVSIEPSAPVQSVRDSSETDSIVSPMPTPSEIMERTFHNNGERSYVRPTAEKLDTISKLKGVPAKCFDVVLQEEVATNDADMVFYILNKSGKVASANCFDNEDLDKILKTTKYLYYRCKPNTPLRTLRPSLDQVESDGIRRIPLSSNVYVMDNQAQAIEPGNKYAFVPTDVDVGKIAAHSVVSGESSAVSAEHCAAFLTDKVYVVKRVLAVEESLLKNQSAGKRRRTRRTLGRIV